MVAEIPLGFCQCGCGQKTNPAKRTRVEFGHIKGEPMRFLHGHHLRGGPEYLVDPVTNCWVWQRALDSWGYGKAKKNRRTVVAHRLYYESEIGPVPEGLELDHLCRNKACVNPAHLEPVTHSVNQRRAHRYRRREESG